MAKLTKAEQDIVQRISKRRRQCLVHRYLYYVESLPLVSDFEYDRIERDLKALVEKYPELAQKSELDGFCPSRKIGSSLDDDYPRQIEQLAKSLLASYQKLLEQV